MNQKFKRAIAAVFTAAIACTAISVTPASAVESSFDIAVVNFDAKLGAGAEKTNLAKIKDYVSEAVAEDDEIILFPEYSLTSEKQDAVDVDSNDSVAEIAKLADDADAYVIFGSVIEEDEDVYSAMIICDPDGNTDTYKKIHLTDEQYADGLSAGTQPYVLNTSYGKFGIAMGNEFAEVPEISKYYYGKACRMILVGQSYGYDTTDANALTQAEYDMYTATYAFLRMYSRPVAVANLFTTKGSTAYFGESHVCTGYQNGWVAGGNEEMTTPAVTTEPGIASAALPESSRDTTNGMSSRKLNLLADWYGELTNYEMPVYGEGSSYKDDVKVASVNFHPIWGDLDANVAKIKTIMEQAANEGVELLVFPEMALTAYSVVLPETYSEEEKAKFGDDYMQHALAQTIRGDNPSETITDLQQLAESYGMYVVIGMPERDEIDPDVYWNSVAILGPNLRQSYRKVNLASPEPNWSAYGTDNQDGIFETSFGLVGVAICADIYNYQELQRTFAERGCRIAINCTAGAANNTTVENGGWQMTYQGRLESFMLRDDTFMITSNLVGYEGPELTGELKESLENAGYTQDDITSSWLVNSNPELYNLLYKYNEETQKYDRLLNARACVFPGSSVCMALDPDSPTGTAVYGNTSDSATIIPYEGQNISSYFDLDGDGKSPYLNYTTDTFDTYCAADFDLSLATLSNFYSENPYAYRPELYFEWYSELFYETYGKAVSEKTLADPSTMVMISGNLAETTVLSAEKYDTLGKEIEGYEIEKAVGYNIDLSAVMTTDVMHTNSSNTAYGATDNPYTGNYAPSLGEVTVTIPVSGGDKTVLYAGEVAAEAENGSVTVTLPGYYALSDITVVTYKLEETPTDAPTDAPTDEPTDAPTDAPTDEPTDAPTDEPTDAPTNAPTDEPTDAPTNAPTDAPTDQPTEVPTDAPTEKVTNTTKTNSNSSNNTNNSGTASSANSTTGKVATGDSTAVAILLIAMAGSALVVLTVRKREKVK